MTTDAVNVSLIQRSDPLASITAAAEQYNNWGRWGADDVLGTLNFIDAAKRVEAAALVTTGRDVLLIATVRHRRTPEGMAPPHQPRPHHD